VSICPTAEALASSHHASSHFKKLLMVGLRGTMAIYNAGLHRSLAAKRKAPLRMKRPLAYATSAMCVGVVELLLERTIEDAKRKR
jgi:hypothetical protein